MARNKYYTTNIQEFKRFLKEKFGVEDFGIWIFETKNNTIRVFSKDLLQIKMKAERGFVVNSKERLSSFFAQLCLKNATKNILELKNFAEIKMFLAREEFPVSYPDDIYIVKYKGHIIGFGIVERGKLRSTFRKKFAREVKYDINSL